MTRAVDCPVCGNTLALLERSTGDVETVNCPVCGNYNITKSSIEVLSNYNLPARRARLEHAKQNTKVDQLPLIKEAERIEPTGIGAH